MFGMERDPILIEKLTAVAVDKEPLLLEDDFFSLQSAQTKAQHVKDGRCQARRMLQVAAVVFAIALLAIGATMVNWRKLAIQAHLLTSPIDEYDWQTAPPRGSGRLRNEMFGYCISRNIPDNKNRDAPVEDYIRSVDCADPRYQGLHLRFQHNHETNRLETVDGECIAPYDMSVCVIVHGEALNASRPPLRNCRPHMCML
jgi:hypothetical protein